MRVGVTGNFASGKGTVCAMFAALGGHVVDTDIIARQIVEPGQPALAELAEHFGREIIDSKGHLDRRLLAEKHSAAIQLLPPSMPSCTRAYSKQLWRILPPAP